MKARSTARMSVDDFLAWADGRDGKWELVEGEVVAMSPERVRHAQVKFAAAIALRRAIRAARLDCEVLIDGVAVRIDATTTYVPDVLVTCGAPLEPDATAIDTPIIVVEVVSPSSRSIDTNRKLAGYLRLPSLIHYLVIDPDAPLVVHHRRADAGGIETRILSSGSLMLALAPPGLTLAVADLFAEPAP